MTTTGKATAKKTASKKTATKATASKKTSAPKAAAHTADKNKAADASKSTSSKSNLSTPIETIMSTLTENTQKFVGQVRDEATKAENLATKMTTKLTEEMNARIESAMVDAVGAARDFTYTAVGAPLAFQAAVTSGELADKALYVNFFADAKVAGEAQLSDLQAKVDPYVKQIAERVEQFESMLPTQVQEAIATNRDRMRKLVNA